MTLIRAELRVARFSGCWTTINDTHAFGMRPMLGIIGISCCQAACLSNSSCVAIDYDHNNGQGKYCWLLSKDRSYVIGPALGVTHYVLDRNCTGKS